MLDINAVHAGQASDISRPEFEDPLWQERNAITRFDDLEKLLRIHVRADVLSDIGTGLSRSGMSMRVNPYVISLIDWNQATSDPIRRQFLPLSSELEPDHPRLAVDSLEERDQSPVQGLVHRYPDKALFLVTTVCPVYCSFCTRSYAVGPETDVVPKEGLAGPKDWPAAIAYIERTEEIEDVVVSGGDVSRLKPHQITALGNALLDIGHVRRIRFATKALSVLPMKVLNDPEWVNAIVQVAERGRRSFKAVSLHTHLNHPREVTPFVDRAMQKLHAAGVLVRNQSVLLRGVNDDAGTLISLIKALGRIQIQPYYVYVCDMVRGIEHFRVPLREAQALEKAVRGATAGFNTPVFVVDTPGGKRDVHSADHYDEYYGVSAFVSPAVAPGRTFYYFDPLRALSRVARQEWSETNPPRKVFSVLTPHGALADA
ncbi:MAG TPA: KamA family radical SAM protein [Rhodospirillales bacterium]|jgi:lysine 2,3-aminomutase|nr:KamA family radical SAM protein [Rhodospirillales bacterium]